MLTSAMATGFAKEITLFPLIIAHTLVKEKAERARLELGREASSRSTSGVLAGSFNRRSGDTILLEKAQKELHLVTERNSELEAMVKSLKKKVRELAGPLRIEVPRELNSRSWAPKPKSASSSSSVLEEVGEESGDLTMEEIMGDGGAAAMAQTMSNTGLALDAINKRRK